jgi:putative membrane protein
MKEFKRNHILTVVDDFISTLVKSFIPLLILFAGRLRGKSRDPWGSSVAEAVLAVILLIMAMLAFLKWYRNVYSIDQNFIATRRGLFVVKRREIPFNKIQTIHLSQNILHRIFGLAELKIDTGNSSGDDAEVSIRIGKREAERIRETILGSRERNGSPEMPEAAGDAGTGRTGAVPGLYGAKGNTAVPADRAENRAVMLQSSPGRALPALSKRIALKALLLSGITSNAVLAGVAFLASVYGLLNDYLSSLLGNRIAELEHYFESLDYGSMALSRIILLIGSAFLVFLLFSFAMSILGTVIKYYGFTVERDKRNISITYGLFEKKNYCIPVKKIKAVYTRQNLLRQLAGLYTIHIESIGYGNEKGEEAILFPIADARKRAEVFRELVPEYLFEEETEHVPRIALGRFIRSYSLFPLLVCIALTALFRLGWLSFLLMPVLILAGILEYRNSAIGVNDRLVCLSGGAFSKSVSFIALPDIQSVTERSNFLQGRKGLFNYMVSIQSNLFGKTIQVKNLSVQMKEKLMGLV